MATTEAALAYLKEVQILTEKVAEEDWKIADRALWAAYELLGLKGRVESMEQLEKVRLTAMQILEAFPEGLPEPVVIG